MENDIRIKSADLKQPYPAVLKRYDLFQLLHYLEQIYAQSDLLYSDITKLPIRLKSAIELNFPTSDIQFIEYGNHDQLELHINFMGLCGVDSPLPQYWSVGILQKDKAFPLNEFLNIFQHSIYILLYLAWKKFQPLLYRENNNPGYLYYLEFLSGKLLNIEKDDKEYAYAGLLGQRVHNAENLRAIISNHLNNIPVIINQFIPQWVEVDNVQLSSKPFRGATINETAIIGKRILDVRQTISINLGPISFVAAVVLLIDQHAKNELLHLIKLYVGLLLKVKILLNIALSQNSNLKFGKDKIYLSWNSAIGKINKEILILFKES